MSDLLVNGKLLSRLAQAADDLLQAHGRDGGHLIISRQTYVVMLRIGSPRGMVQEGLVPREGYTDFFDVGSEQYQVAFVGEGADMGKLIVRHVATTMEIWVDDM